MIAADRGAAESLGPSRILPFGDSITFGMGYEGGYRIELFRQALEAGRSITFLGSQRNGPEQVDDVSFPQQHEGHGGLRIDQLMPLVPLLASPEAPDIVLLMAGTNDIGQEHDEADAPERLGQLIDQLTEALPDALVVVAKLTPLETHASGVIAFNDALDAVLELRSDEHVELVDMFAGFPETELGDGVHPTAAGYERMAHVWYEAICDRLRATTSP